VLIAGIRVSVVNAVGLATLASLIGAGGLGDLVFRGISTVSLTVVMAGSIPIIVMAVAADLLLKAGERQLSRRMLGAGAA
jgi:osmoprotectant transport system permease protein